ncbi:SMI1/KNR4 family protein [Stackebrandtia albiflava]|uniref:SMI1/KNR4 family protein n=1 Tax=Stackebrandtia albiflava TaxID=406432 RepID=UPI001315732A|nr:SMI1/KNR4 family protein [Stackebrandtia albiflava]
MNPIEAVHRVSSLLRRYSGFAHATEGCDDRAISRTESRLNVRLPPSFRMLMRSAAGFDIAGREFLGISGTEAGRFDVVSETEFARSIGMPGSLVVVSLDEPEGMAALCTSVVDSSGECPVVHWNPTMETAAEAAPLATDYGAYVLSGVLEAVGYWDARESATRDDRAPDSDTRRRVRGDGDVRSGAG